MTCQGWQKCIFCHEISSCPQHSCLHKRLLVLGLILRGPHQGVLVFSVNMNHFYFRFPIMLFYTCQCGFYINSTAALLIWETRRKDFSVMMSHHAITVVWHTHTLQGNNSVFALVLWVVRQQYIIYTQILFQFHHCLKSVENLIFLTLYVPTICHSHVF